MSQCVIDFDTCHQICFPEEQMPGDPATVPGAPGTGAPGDEDEDGLKKHKDVTNDAADNDEDDEQVGIAVGVAVGGGETKVLYGKGKGKKHSVVKAAAKEALALTLTPEEINRLQQSYTDEDDESIIDAPAGGEDAAEFDDDPSDY